MSDRFQKLQALANKRKHESDDEEDNKPTVSKKNKSFLQKRPVKPNKYADSESESSSEDNDDEDDEEEEEEEDNNSSDEEEVKPKKKPSKPIRKPIKKASKGSDDEGGSEDDKSGISDDELEQLDSSLIIKGGRRTRGRKIDYTQFGADPVDEE